MSKRSILWLERARDESPGEGIDRRRHFLAPHPTDHDPFILWGEDWFRAGAFDWHPHRGFATISYLTNGSLRHFNSLGDEGVLGPGDASVTVAGAGLWHHAEPQSSVVRGAQMWVNLPAAHKMESPWESTSRGDDAPTFGNPDFLARVHVGTCNDVRGPLQLPHSVTFVALEFQSGSLTLQLPDDDIIHICVLDGALDMDGTRLDAGQSVRLTPGPDAVRLKALAPGLALVASGTPIRETVVIDGPFVMNTQEEIAQAYRDRDAGVMGRPPVAATP